MLNLSNTSHHIKATARHRSARSPASARRNQANKPHNAGAAGPQPAAACAVVLARAAGAQALALRLRMLRQRVLLRKRFPPCARSHPVAQVCMAACVSRSLRDLAADAELWKALWKREVPGSLQPRLMASANQPPASGPAAPPAPAAPARGPSGAVGNHEVGWRIAGSMHEETLVAPCSSLEQHHQLHCSMWPRRVVVTMS